MTPDDIEGVVKKAKAGDRVAHDMLMAHFYAWTAAQVKKVVHDWELAKDVALDFWAWIRNENGLESYSGGDFHNWMATRLKNRALPAARKKRPRIVYTGSDVMKEPAAGDFTQQIEACEDLEEIARGLQGTEREVFWRLVEGATADEIADECGFSVKRAKNMIAKIRKHIEEVV